MTTKPLKVEVAKGGKKMTAKTRSAEKEILNRRRDAVRLRRGHRVVIAGIIYDMNTYIVTVYGEFGLTV